MWLGEKGLCNRNKEPSFVFINCSGVNSQRMTDTDCSESQEQEACWTCGSRTCLHCHSQNHWIYSEQETAFSTKIRFAPLLSTLQNLNPQYLKNSISKIMFLILLFRTAFTVKSKCVPVADCFGNYFPSVLRFEENHIYW